MTEPLSHSDRALIELLRQMPAMTVGQLVDSLGVTATAVRQRLVRLMALRLVSRSQTAVGRGRPSHHYELTEKGRQAANNNLGDLAVVLWEEVQQIADPELRRKVISGVVERLAKKYEKQMQGETIEERMRSFSQLFAEREIPVAVEHKDGLPVIKVSGCPYPTLADDNRDICEMEQKLLERMIGHPVDLCQCQQDGDRCCSFQSTERETDNKHPHVNAV
jgi:predicted ArsR family transcriptional regulator